MPQNTKDSQGGKNHPAKNTSANGGKQPNQEAKERKPDSPIGSQNKGEKKTTP